MGDDNEGDADLVLHTFELELHLLAQLLVEGAERLVEQQHPRPLDPRAGQRDALALAAREAVGLAVAEAGKLGHLQDIADPAGYLGARQALHFQAVGNVLRHRHVREEGVGLEHEVHRPAVGPQRRHVLAVEQDAPRVGLRETGDHAQEGGLAAARGAQQREELVLDKVEVGGLHCRDLSETLGKALKRNDGRRAHGVTAPLFTRCAASTRVKLTSMMTVAKALISGVTPKRIIE